MCGSQRGSQGEEIVPSGNSLVVQWWGLYAFTAEGWIQSLVGEWRSYKPSSTAPKKERERKKAPSEGSGRRKKWDSEPERAWVCHDSLLQTVSYEPENTHGGLCVHAKSLQLSPPLCDHMGCSPPGSSVHGISQTRILERIVISFSRGPSWPWDQTQISCIGRWVLYRWATKEAPQQRLDCRKIYFPLDHIWSSLSKL